MIAADTSTWIAYLQGASDDDANLLDRALQDQQVWMIPAVLTELLSDPKLSRDVTQALLHVPLVELQPGYWERAGLLRAAVQSKRKKARLGDVLIAQCCADRGISLITREGDFRTLAQHAELRLL